MLAKENIPCIIFFFLSVRTRAGKLVVYVCFQLGRSVSSEIPDMQPIL